MDTKAVLYDGSHGRVTRSTEPTGATVFGDHCTLAGPGSAHITIERGSYVDVYAFDDGRVLITFFGLGQRHLLAIGREGAVTEWQIPRQWWSRMLRGPEVIPC